MYHVDITIVWCSTHSQNSWCFKAIKIGRTFNLDEAVINSRGKLKIDDSYWTVESKLDIPAGEKVKVIGVDGTILQVEHFISD